MTWKELHNFHKNETCIIIGNGPSLSDVPVDFLNKYSSFGSNRIYLLGEFTPTYYVCINPLVINQFLDEINAITCTKFIRSAMQKNIDGALGLKSLKDCIFSYSPDKGVQEGWTVTYVIMQLAFFMGFQRALLVGLDHRYLFDGPPNSESDAFGPDYNHFHPDYFTDGTKWNNPDLIRSEQYYKIANNVFAENDREIINLTPGTRLDVFRKEELERWIC
jgi:hypothetical protein